MLVTQEAPCTIMMELAGRCCNSSYSSYYSTLLLLLLLLLIQVIGLAAWINKGMCEDSKPQGFQRVIRILRPLPLLLLFLVLVLILLILLFLFILLPLPLLLFPTPTAIPPLTPTAGYSPPTVDHGHSRSWEGE